MDNLSIIYKKVIFNYFLLIISYILFFSYIIILILIKNGFSDFLNYIWLLITTTSLLYVSFFLSTVSFFININHVYIDKKTKYIFVSKKLLIFSLIIIIISTIFFCFNILLLNPIIDLKTFLTFLITTFINLVLPFIINHLYNLYKNPKEYKIYKIDDYKILSYNGCWYDYIESNFKNLIINNYVNNFDHNNIFLKNYILFLSKIVKFYNISENIRQKNIYYVKHNFYINTLKSSFNQKINFRLKKIKMTMRKEMKKSEHKKNYATLNKELIYFQSFNYFFKVGLEETLNYPIEKMNFWELKGMKTFLLLYNNIFYDLEKNSKYLYEFISRHIIK